MLDDCCITEMITNICSYSTVNDLTEADPHQLVECIKRVFDQNYSSLVVYLKIP